MPRIPSCISSDAGRAMFVSSTFGCPNGRFGWKLSGWSSLQTGQICPGLVNYRNWVRYSVLIFLSTGFCPRGSWKLGRLNMIIIGQFRLRGRVARWWTPKSFTSSDPSWNPTVSAWMTWCINSTVFIRPSFAGLKILCQGARRHCMRRALSSTFMASW